MTILALYIPKPEQLTGAIVILAMAYIVLCGLAYRMKLSVPLAAVLMLIGCSLALTPQIISVARADLGSYGDHARELSKTDHSDAFFEMTAYMYVGQGKLVAFGGMSAMLICHAVVDAIRQRLKRSMSDPVKDDLLATESSSSSPVD